MFFFEIFIYQSFVCLYVCWYCHFFRLSVYLSLTLSLFYLSICLSSCFISVCLFTVILFQHFPYCVLLSIESPSQNHFGSTGPLNKNTSFFLSVILSTFSPSFFQIINCLFVYLNVEINIFYELSPKELGFC